MAGKLTTNSYGKQAVRVTKVIRKRDVHELLEMGVDVRLEGDFQASYTDGDNTTVIATDSMKNMVYVLAKTHSFNCPEEFALLFARHLCKTYPQVSLAEVCTESPVWERLSVAGKPHPHAFYRGVAAHRVSRARCKSSGEASLSAGVDNIEVIKTTDSEFHSFVTDQYRTLKDTRDRILGTAINAMWDYTDLQGDFTNARRDITHALLECFASHHSLAVQQSILLMGEAALAASPIISGIDITLPNQHRIPFNFEPLGLTNDNDVFITTSEPYGQIHGRIERR